MKCQSLFSAKFVKRIVKVKKAFTRTLLWKNRRQFSLLPPVNEKAACITKTRLFKYTENFTTKKWQFFR